MLSSKFSKSTHSVEKCIVLKNGQTYFKVAKHTLKFLQKKRYVLTFSTLYIKGLNGQSFLICLSLFSISSSRPVVVCKKGVLKNLGKFTGKQHMCF